MEKIVTKVAGEGLESLLGKRVLLLCMNYFYEGKLSRVDNDVACLEKPSIVYDTGAWNSDTYSDIQQLHCKVLYVRLAYIEAFADSKLKE